MAKRATAQSSRDEQIKHVRDFVNARRKELNLRATGRLSKGYPGPLNPVAQSLEKVGVLWAGYDEDQVILTGRNKAGEFVYRAWTDAEVAQFMRDFDAGEYPELAIAEKPIKVAGQVVLHAQD